MKTRHIHVTGIVQGVGFRPFVYGLANRLDLHGWVCNTSAGVEIEVQGTEDNLHIFCTDLLEKKPPLARIDHLELTEAPGQILYNTFEIRESTFLPGAFQPISADVAICEDCTRELFSPNDRRYLYPFINCTNCGPRFTIIRDIPYDRPATTMASFMLCPDCLNEYKDPLDRRFHAQPVACPQCGPSVWLEQPGGTLKAKGLQAILAVRRLIREGKIVSIKGLGGFHLACDAGNVEAVETLRRRKGRHGKPFALMAADLLSIEQNCHLSPAEHLLLSGSAKPIVLLKRHQASKLDEQVAPGVNTLGFMLPYTPLHHLLLNQTDLSLAVEPVPPVVVMTSGNYSEDPIATENTAALKQLAPLADAFLLHNRDIHIRCDDSVVCTDDQQRPIHIRRSRGYAPYPVQLPFETLPTLAVGGELKNTFCITRDRYAFLSHHIGDMENVETYASFEQGIRHLTHLFRVQPEIIACDLHPGYFSTQWACSNPFGKKTITVQHHHAHIAACMADNHLLDHKVIGLAYDGTGYGTDAAIWGGEVLIAEYGSFTRSSHLEYLPLPGGEEAIHKPWRIAVGYAHALGLDISDLSFVIPLDPRALEVVRLQVDKKLNAPDTSSIGRLFDAVAALAGVCTVATYEAQAAIELETLSTNYLAGAKQYPFELQNEIICLQDLLAAVIESVRRKDPPGLIGAQFHKTIAALSTASACRVREQTGLNEVVLSGGVWQNRLLLKLTLEDLEKQGFNVYIHRQTPSNDGGISLGQAVVANHIHRMHDELKS